MVLVLNGIVQNKPPKSMQKFLHENRYFKEQAKKFLETPIKTVQSPGLLYVQQRELAVSGPSDLNIDVIGSEDATTCIIAVLRHSACGAVAVCHMDGSYTDECVATMIERVKELAEGTADGLLDLLLVGAFIDKNNYSEAVFRGIMCSFHQHSEKINIILACVGELNTTVRNGENWPAVYGIGLNVKTGEYFPAVFPDKGPDMALRLAHNLCSNGEVLEIYNCRSGKLMIGPFNYTPLHQTDLFLELPDDDLLNYMSTSPEVEPPYFISTIREALKFTKDHPNPAETIFKGNKPRCYVRDKSTKEWIFNEE